MRTIWQALAWKEWHEHKWKLGSVTAIVVAVSSLPILDYDRSAFSIAAILAIFCIAPLAVFIGAGEATSERARGTLPFTQALPVPMWRVAIHKIVAGLLTCVLPVLFNLAIFSAMYYTLVYFQADRIPVITNPLSQTQGTVGLKVWFWYAATAAIAVATSLFLWTATLGVNRKDEISASALALAVFVVWWTSLVMVPAVFSWNPKTSEEWIVALAVAIAPGGYPMYMSGPIAGIAGFLIYAAPWLIPMGLSIVFVRRFGSLAAGDARSPATALARRKATNWLDRPMSSPLTALAWKQVRESGPVALAGMAGVIGTMLVIFAATRDYNINNLGAVLAGSTAVFGLVATLVVGIGVFLSDLTPSIHNFWRSRPIEVNLWFWTKYAVGILVLGVAFSTPLVAASLMSAAHDIPSWREIIMWVVLLPLWTYSATIMTTVLVRQAVYAGILSWAAMYVSFLIVVGTARLVKFETGRITWREMTDPTASEMAATMILATMAFTLIAWLAIRYDWGVKSRY